MNENKKSNRNTNYERLLKCYVYDIDKLMMERVRQGMSLRELAAKADLDIKTVMRIEQHKTRPRPQSLGRIANALGKDISEFIVKVPQEESK